jgi:DNA-binding FadR family transcriptional regulator
MEERALQDHEQLVALITARDADAAGHLARRHAGIDLDLLERFRARA